MGDYPNIEAMAGGTISGEWREWPKVRAEAKAVLKELERAESKATQCPECGRRGDHCAEYQAQAQKIERLKDALERAQCIVKGVHGALTDAGNVPVPALDADLYESVMQIVRERDEARDRERVLSVCCNNYAADVVEMGRLCGITDDEYPLAAVRRFVAAAEARIAALVRERDTIAAHAEQAEAAVSVASQQVAALIEAGQRYRDRHKFESIFDDCDCRSCHAFDRAKGGAK